MTNGERIKTLRTAVRDAAKQFREYERIHLAKIPTALTTKEEEAAREKAAANATCAEYMERVLKETRQAGQPL